jgi:glycosyltransferase involved in cell wall biosynthesis
MTTFGIAMVRDEADIVEHTVSQMLTQVDRVIVADNGSVDGTREILERLDVTVVDDPDPAYYQSRKMTTLAHLAAAQGAEWVVAFDADEFWYSPFGRIADILKAHEGAVATAAIFDHRATAVDPSGGDPLERMGWRLTEPLPLHKIACRPILRATITQGNHSAHYETLAPLEGQIVIRHFPIRSIEQMIRKARNGGKAYEATDLPEDAGGHWRGWNRLTDEQIADVFREFYWHADPQADGLIFDPAPR